MFGAAPGLCCRPEAPRRPTSPRSPARADIVHLEAPSPLTAEYPPTGTNRHADRTGNRAGGHSMVRLK
ncbi:hypothetical protein [Lysobacter gummosus]|uniref:hypothetical protein n=1 Tax=Lysobacter gummosus TaxID=262324 RepID=UPI00362D8390